MQTNKFRPVAILEDRIANVFHLEKKGRKLLGVGFALFGAMAGVSILVLAGLLVCGLDLYLWWKAMLPWIPVSVWAFWRFFLRYIHPKAFVCKGCGRLKCVKSLSTRSVIDHTSVCLECERRTGEADKLIQDIHNGLNGLLGDVEFKFRVRK